MDGCKVIVHDSEYDEYDQECEVRVFKDIAPHPFKKRKMTEYVKKRLDEITKLNLYDIGLSEEELKRRKNKKYELKKALKGCTYGDVNDKRYVKELIFDLLQKEYGVTETNVSKAIPFDMLAIACSLTPNLINFPA